ncbi:MAG: ATP-binding protein [bacterium]|nr:ATP-binding protein [bacterium]
MCEWDTARFFIFSDNVFGNLIYYSHLLPLVVSLLFGLFLFLKNRKLLATKWFFVTTILLSAWLFFDLILWASERPDLIMFFWSLVNMIEPMIYAGVLFFMYAFIDGKDLSFNKKLLVFVMLLPTVILASTSFNLASYDLTNCWREVIEGPLPYYSYAVEIVFALWILVLGMERFVKFHTPADKKKVALITIGAVFFLLSFAMGNVVGSLLVDWVMGQYGLFGIPVFMAMLSYLIVKYQAFNVKLIATQMLVVAIWVLTLAILFVRRIENVQIIVLITLFLFTILGYHLIKSVKREVSLREQLQVANEGQADLLHIINHQIKGYMTKARYVLDALINDPDYGPVSETAKPLVKEGYDSVTEGVNFVQDFLTASNIERGTFTYNMESLDLKEVVEKVAVGQKENATQKGLSFDLAIKEGDYNMKGDKGQLGQAARNLIDNSIKYTPTGGLKVNLERQADKILFTVKDTGVGISEELKPKLFTKGGRDKDSQKININSTGFGLAFVKGVAEAHKGRVWAESPGAGKGATFYMELPLN